MAHGARATDAGRRVGLLDYVLPAVSRDSVIEQRGLLGRAVS